jgi:hypothetical protein
VLLAVGVSLTEVRRIRDEIDQHIRDLLSDLPGL